MGNVHFLYPKNETERFFETEENHKLYLEAEQALRKEKVDIGFDWRALLAIIFGRVS